MELRCELLQCVAILLLVHVFFHKASVPPSTIATVETQWLEALWHTQSEEVVCSKSSSCTPKVPTCFQDVSGPHIIFRPTLLLNSLEKRFELTPCMLAYLTRSLRSQIVGVSLASLEQHGELVKRHIKLSVLQCFMNTSRLQQLTALFNQSLVLVSNQ